MAPIKTALLSFGMSGRVFHAPFLHLNPGFELYGIWERDKNLSKALYPYVRVYRSFEEILQDEAIELVVVNTPNYTHYEFTRAVLNAGKHAVVEKPFTVTVEEGTVEIAGNVLATKGLPAMWRAEAGYQLTYSSQGRTAMIASVDTSSALKWRSGELAYVWEPLGAVVEDLNRYSEHKVIIKDPAIAELRFTGTVFTASLADWVKAIEQAYPVRADSTANVDIMLVERR